MPGSPPAPVATSPIDVMSPQRSRRRSWPGSNKNAKDKAAGFLNSKAGSFEPQDVPPEAHEEMRRKLARRRRMDGTGESDEVEDDRPSPTVIGKITGSHPSSDGDSSAVAEAPRRKIQQKIADPVAAEAAKGLSRPRTDAGACAEQPLVKPQRRSSPPIVTFSCQEENPESPMSYKGADALAEARAMSERFHRLAEAYAHLEDREKRAQQLAEERQRCARERGAEVWKLQEILDQMEEDRAKAVGAHDRDRTSMSRRAQEAADTMEQEMASKDEELRALRARCDDLQANLSQAIIREQEAVERQELEAVRHDAKVRAAEAAVQEAATQHQQESARKEMEVTRQEEKLRAAEDACEELRQNLLAATIQTEEQESESRIQVAKVQELEARCAELHESLTNAVQREQDQASDSRQQAAKVHELEAKCAELQEGLSNAAQREQDQASDSRQQAAKVHELEAKCAELQEGLSNAALREQDRESDASLQAAKVQELESKCAELQDGLTNAMQREQELRQKCEESEASVTKLTDELAQAAVLTTEKTVQLSECLDSKQQLIELKATLHETEQVVATVRHELAEETETATLYKSELEELRLAHEQVKEQLRAERRQAEEQLSGQDGEVKQLTAEKVSMQGELEKIRESVDAELTTLRRQVEDLNSEVEHWWQKFEEERRLRQSGCGDGCDHDCAKMRTQNRELTLTVQQFRQDSELAEVLRLSLEDTNGRLRADLENLTERHAQLLGHTNQQQKIRYTLALKEEINALRDELCKSRQQVARLELSRRGTGLFDALLSSIGVQHFLEAMGGGSAPTDRLASTLPVAAGGMDRRSRSPPRHTSSPSRTVLLDDEQRRLAEAERVCESQAHALEHLSIEFFHLKSLLERAVCIAEAKHLFAEGDERPKDKGDSGLSELLQQLRSLIEEAQKGQQPAQTTPPHLITAGAPLAAAAAKVEPGVVPPLPVLNSERRNSLPKRRSLGGAKDAWEAVGQHRVAAAASGA